MSASATQGGHNHGVKDSKNVEESTAWPFWRRQRVTSAIVRSLHQYESVNGYKLQK